MRLGEFILRDMEQILQRWDAFASTRLPAAHGMSSSALRDHGPQILRAIVADLANAQTPEEQSLKSMGIAPVDADAPETAAQTHAVFRAKSGFNIDQLASEYRALRASVLSAWMEACLPEPPAIDDMIRFNEAIDQALAESIGFFTTHVTRARNLLLGMLSHDLRSPLQSIQMTAKYLRKLDTTNGVSDAAARLIRSGARMQKLLDDLIDFNRTELGLGLKVMPREVDLAEVCGEELEEIRATYAGHPLELEVDGDCRGAWDPDRIQQLLDNLVLNALHYGEPRATVTVALNGSERDVRLSVASTGDPIDEESLTLLFEPLRRGQTNGNNSGLGLGLYIVSEIVKAHGGTVGAHSAGRQTVFTVKLPKIASAANAGSMPRGEVA
jgi:signal transduction histidine kinase